MLGEDVEDELCAVDDTRLQGVLQRALLGRRQLLVDDEHLGVALRIAGLELCELALPDERARIQMFPVLHELGDGDDACRARELAELGELFLSVDTLGEDPEDEPALRRRPWGGIGLLDRGEVRVAEKRGDEWVVNEWTKKAILLYFRLRKVEPLEVGGLHFLDKIPVKADYAERGVRVVPPGVARYGSFMSDGVILMPGFVNIGAWVGPRTMVDTWATVGSCAQIGADVHLAGGVGIGGVLEPPQARPV